MELDNEDEPDESEESSQSSIFQELGEKTQLRFDIVKWLKKESIFHNYKVFN